MAAIRSLILAGALLGGTAAAAHEPPPLPATISPQARDALTAMAAATPAPGAAAMPSLADMRAMTDMVQQHLGAARRARYEVAVEDATIAGVPVRIFTPKGGATTDAVLLNVHGGGFLLDSGSLTENIALSALTGMKIVAVLYRLAPEHPYPAAVDDTVAVYRDLLKTHPATKIGLFGTSAGAVLSAQTIARLHRDGIAAPAAMGFFSGSADFSTTGDSEQVFPGPGGVPLMQMTAPYVGQTKTDDALLSPLHGDLSRFPPTLVLTSTRDSLLSASVIFHRALMKAGVEADLVVFEGLPHAFWAYIDAPETDDAFAIMAAFFNRHFPASKPR